MRMVNATLNHVETIAEHGDAGDHSQMLEMLHALPDPDASLDMYGRTLLLEEEPIAMVGAWPLWYGVSRAWAIFTPEAKHRPISLFKLAKSQLDFVVKREQLHRLEAVVVSGHLAGQRLLRHLDFQREALLKAFGPDRRDYHLFARTFL